MRGLRFRKGRNLPEVIQLVRRELGFMLRCVICLARLLPFFPPSLQRVWVGSGCGRWLLWGLPPESYLS